MQKISKFLVNHASQTPITRRLAGIPQVNRAQPFSIQTEMQSFDFSDKLNVEELKLKNPTNT